MALYGHAYGHIWTSFLLFLDRPVHDLHCCCFQQISHDLPGDKKAQISTSVFPYLNMIDFCFDPGSNFSLVYFLNGPWLMAVALGLAQGRASDQSISFCKGQTFTKTAF